MLKPTATVPVSTQGRHGDGSWCKYKQMSPLNLPSFNIKTKVQGGRTLVSTSCAAATSPSRPKNGCASTLFIFWLNTRATLPLCSATKWASRLAVFHAVATVCSTTATEAAHAPSLNIKPPLCLSRSRFSRKLPPTTVFSELIISSSRTESTTIAATLITRPGTWNICAKSRLIQN